MSRCEWAGCPHTFRVSLVDGWAMCPAHVREHLRQCGEETVAAVEVTGRVTGDLQPSRSLTALLTALDRKDHYAA